MPRSARLTLSPLESREVPAAGLFADIRPGVWGSNPTGLTTSGDTLFFSANDIYHGTELWASDGTPAGTRMVKDLNPGKPGSSVWGLAAGGGVLYVTQTNEYSTARTDYKTDGTAAGTVPIANGYTTIAANGGTVVGGWKGDLYYLTATQTPGVWQLRRTNGTTESIVTDFNGQPLKDEGWTTPNRPVLPDWVAISEAADRITLSVVTAAGQKQVWQTDGTPAGTTLQQSNLTAASAATGAVQLTNGVTLGGGQFLFRALPNAGGTNSVWTGDGTGTTRTLLRTFDGPLGFDAVAVNGTVLFEVGSDAASGTSADAGVWVTDGTAAGTKKLALPAEGGRYPFLATNYATYVTPATLDGKAVVAVPTADPLKWTAVLTDGTAAGTAGVPTPAGTAGLKWYFAGLAPADAASPKGYLVFGEEASGKVYRTDGTAAGTKLIDTTGLRHSPDWWPVAVLAGGRVGLGAGWADGVLFKGDVYYAGRDPNIAPTDYTQMRYGTELYKWDLTAAPTTPTPTPTPAPKVLSTQVNDGSAQRSMVNTLTVTFDSAVNVDPTGVTVYNVAGNATAFSQQLATANGKTTLTITFPSGVGGSIADGRWTLKINAGAVKTQTGGTAMASNYTFGFTRVFGDTSGDGLYDRDTRTLVKQLLGQTVGSPGYRWDLDVNSDGKIDAADELAAIRNWGKGV